MRINWTNFKNIIDSKSIKIQCNETDGYYNLSAYDENIEYKCEIFKDPSDTTDLDDFVNNYLPSCNSKISPEKDSDGAILARSKITETGWHYQLHSVEFTTSLQNSIVSKDEDGNDYNFSTTKFYDSNNNELTDQNDISSSCVKTVLDWEPTNDYELLGGMLKQQSLPGSDIWLWAIGVPDIAQQYGGTKVFVSSVNLKTLSLSEGIKADGKTAKYMTYDSTYHTNKLRLILRHSSGVQHYCNFLFEIFEP